MESRNKILKSLLLVLLLLGLLISLFFYFKSSNTNVNDTKESPQEIIKPKLIAISNEVTKTELDSFFQDFIKAFNSNKAKNINQFIDKKDGFVECIYDGCYPLIIFGHEIEYIEWFRSKIYENISSEKFPEYLGDCQFEQTGFFYEEYRNKFKLDDFDNAYVNLPESTFKANNVLEKKCNYRAQAMDVGGNLIYSFYFSITKKSKKLVGLSYDFTSDCTYADPKKNFIPFDTNLDIENYITRLQKFCDPATKSYLDFGTKEFTYCDFNEPFVFKIYEIGKVEVQSKKIKIRTIKFYREYVTDDYEQYFTMELSNKGTFFVRPMGARPQYEYSDCK